MAAGVGIANGAPALPTLTNLVQTIRNMSGEKGPRLWPNFAKPDNYYHPMLLNPDTQFCSPGYLFMTNP